MVYREREATSAASLLVHSWLPWGDPVCVPWRWSCFFVSLVFPALPPPALLSLEGPDYDFDSESSSAPMKRARLRQKAL